MVPYSVSLVCVTMNLFFILLIHLLGDLMAQIGKVFAFPPYLLIRVSARHELLHLYGQKRSDHSCTPKQSWYMDLSWLVLAGPVSLGTLATYKDAFDEIRVNGRVSKSQWASFMVKIRTELAQTTLIVCPSVALLICSLF